MHDCLENDWLVGQFKLFVKVTSNSGLFTPTTQPHCGAVTLIEEQQLCESLAVHVSLQMNAAMGSESIWTLRFDLVSRRLHSLRVFEADLEAQVLRNSLTTHEAGTHNYQSQSYLANILC